jgi:outer membrane protein assembly factor BamE (lipoprotein component of BamABCDE complex)
MKTLLVSTVRIGAIFPALVLLSFSASAKDTASIDRETQLFASLGRLPVSAAGPYVEVGTYRVQVMVKLGRPGARFSNDTWLYENFKTENGSVCGTLIVQFEQGRVRSLSLADPAQIAALRNSHEGNKAGAFVATN